MTVDPPGSAAEALVVAWLIARGWLLIGRRLRFGPLELDIVARRGDIAIVVEVRGRRVDGWLAPLDTIDTKKRARLRRAARRLWTKTFANDESIRVLRIDVAAVVWSPDRAPTIEMIEGAIDFDDAS